MKTVYSPMAKEAVVEKIKNGDVKVKEQTSTKQTAAASKTHPAAKAKREQLSFTTEQLVAAVKSVGHPAGSREISDKLGIKDSDQGRAYIRSRMAALVKDKKIVTSKPEDKSRCTFLYSVA